jgi:hypothetical protein
MPNAIPLTLRLRFHGCFEMVEKCRALHKFTAHAWDLRSNLAGKTGLEITNITCGFQDLEKKYHSVSRICIRFFFRVQVPAFSRIMASFNGPRNCSYQSDAHLRRRAFLKVFMTEVTFRQKPAHFRENC